MPQPGDNLHHQQGSLGASKSAYPAGEPALTRLLLSQTASSELERECHMRLSGLFADLLGMNHYSSRPEPQMAEGGASR
jgi:hypothetical protein